VHLAESGHPLLCDTLYGAGRKAKGRVAEAQQVLGRQALHAWMTPPPYGANQLAVSARG
jgi:23S rRNA pseudouridine1911/1915/1917 synthase